MTKGGGGEVRAPGALYGGYVLVWEWQSLATATESLELNIQYP